MKYDFTSILDRRGRDAIAVDGLKGDGFSPAPPKAGFDAIPMWVADMNFPTVPTIQEAIIERAKHPAFGYFQATDAYFDSIIRWHEKRNGVTGLKPEHIGYENGVLGGVISALNCVCSRGDKILIHSPTYIGFTMSLKNNGYEAVHSPLVKDENGVWRMDFADTIASNALRSSCFFLRLRFLASTARADLIATVSDGVSCGCIFCSATTDIVSLSVKLLAGTLFTARFLFAAF